jgi:hypothetical protein
MITPGPRAHKRLVAAAGGRRRRPGHGDPTQAGDSAALMPSSVSSSARWQRARWPDAASRSPPRRGIGDESSSRGADSPGSAPRPGPPRPALAARGPGRSRPSFAQSLAKSYAGCPRIAARASWFSIHLRRSMSDGFSGPPPRTRSTPPLGAWPARAARAKSLATARRPGASAAASARRVVSAPSRQHRLDFHPFPAGTVIVATGPRHPVVPGPPPSPTPGSINSSARWQRTRWPGATSRSAGGSVRHKSTTCGQRGWK